MSIMVQAQSVQLCDLNRFPSGNWFLYEPDVDTVPALMTELVDWLNADDGSHPLVRAAMAHLQLVSVHPWADGNGRMSRSPQTLMIAREGVLAPEFSSIEAWLGRPGNTWEYSSAGAT